MSRCVCVGNSYQVWVHSCLGGTEVSGGAGAEGAGQVVNWQRLPEGISVGPYQPQTNQDRRGWDDGLWLDTNWCPEGEELGKQRVPLLRGWRLWSCRLAKG